MMKREKGKGTISIHHLNRKILKLFIEKNDSKEENIVRVCLKNYQRRLRSTRRERDRYSSIHPSISINCPICFDIIERERSIVYKRAPRITLAATCALHVAYSSFLFSPFLFINSLPLFLDQIHRGETEQGEEASVVSSEIPPPLSSISRSATFAMAGGSSGHRAGEARRGDQRRASASLAPMSIFISLGGVAATPCRTAFSVSSSA